MFKKLVTTTFIVSSLFCAVALAKGPAIEFRAEMAKELGMDKKELDKNIDELVRRGEIKAEDLEKAGKGDVVLKAKIKTLTINVLENKGKVVTGMKAMTDSKVSGDLAREVEALGSEHGKSADKTATRLSDKAQKAIAANLSPAALDAVVRDSKQAYGQRHEAFASVHAARVAKGDISKDLANEAVLAVAESPSKLGGETILGEGATKLCKIAEGAGVENYDKLTIAGVREAKKGDDVDGVLRGMERADHDEFGKDDNFGARFCALQGRCKTWNPKLNKICGPGAQAAR
jgi:hypothetical protein